MQQYTFKNVAVTVGGRIIEGFFSGDDVAKASYNNDMFNLLVGAGGDSTRSQSSDKSGTISIKLLVTAEDNAYLNSLHKKDVESGSGVVSLIIKSIDTGSTITAPQAWIKKTAEVSYGANGTARDWVFETDNMTIDELQ